MLCEFWSRLANGNTTYNFVFKTFSKRAVYDKLTHMEKLLNDDKLFRMPIASPAHQQNTIIAHCKKLATSEGKVELGNKMQGIKGKMWAQRDGTVAALPQMPQCPGAALSH